MKQFAVGVVVVVGLVLIGCGSNNNSSANTVNGTWNASLMSGGKLCHLRLRNLDDRQQRQVVEHHEF